MNVMGHEFFHALHACVNLLGFLAKIAIYLTLAITDESAAEIRKNIEY